MTQERSEELRLLAQSFRKELITLLHEIQTGHPGGSLSATEILITLYYDIMRNDPSRPDMEGRDLFILSKGHAAPMLYITLANKGYFPVSELHTLRQIDSRLQGHPCRHKTPGVELSSGPLGLGLAAAVGMAMSEKLKKSDSTIYVLMGDGELQEGVVWEACMSANKFKADNLVVIVDNNGVQLDGTVEKIMPEGDLAAKFASFGWEVLRCDGHDIPSIANALETAKAVKGKPCVILAKTVKGKGVSFMEGKNTWHGKIISDTDYALAMRELGGAV